MGTFLDIVIKLLVGCLVLFTCMPIHECAHAWVAEKMGDSTGRYQGRITLNPMAHLDLVGSICLLASSLFGFGFGWAKPVQVNPTNFKNQKVGMGLTALAGPVANLLMAFIVMIVYKIFYYLAVAGLITSTAGYFITLILQYVILLNVGLAVFNLIPVPPLDGSKIIGLVLPQRIYFKMLSYERIISIVLLVLVFSGILSPVIGFLRNISLNVLEFLTGFVDLIMKAILY